MKNKIVKITEKELKEIIENKLNNNDRKEYYVAWSSWFETHPYNIELIISTLKSMGVEDIYKENQFGWSNQPEVVVFMADEGSEFINSKEIEKRLQRTIGTEWIIIKEKDWSSSETLDEIVSIDSETAERDPDLVKKLQDKIGKDDVIKISEQQIRKLIENKENPRITKNKLLESLKIKTNDKRK